MPDTFILGDLNGVNDGKEGRGEEKEGDVGEPEAKGHEKKKKKNGIKKGTKDKRRIARAVEDYSGSKKEFMNKPKERIDPEEWSLRETE
jgi:hypothetical protein